VVIAQRNPISTFVPTRILSSTADEGVPAGLIVLGLGVEVAVIAGVIALYRSRKKK
jgi:hypothetical protein